MTKRRLATGFSAVFVGLAVTLVGVTISGCGNGDQDGKAGSSTRVDGRTSRRAAVRAMIPLVPPLSFAGATFTDGDDTRDVDTVTLHTWTDKTKLPTVKSDPSTWETNVSTSLTQIDDTPTWTAGDLDLQGVVALAFVVETHPPGNTMNKTTTINYTQVINLNSQSAGLAESRITATNVITNRVLGGNTDPAGPMDFYIIVDPNKER